MIEGSRHPSIVCPGFWRDMLVGLSLQKPSKKHGLLAAFSRECEKQSKRQREVSRKLRVQRTIVLVFCVPRWLLLKSWSNFAAKSPKTTTFKRNSANFVGISFSSNMRQTQCSPEASERPHSLAKALFCLSFPFFALILPFCWEIA